MLGVTGLAALLLLAWAVSRSGTWPASDALPLLLLPAFFWLLALTYWRTQLAIGDLGFRLVNPWRPLAASKQFGWGDIAGCDVESSANMRGSRTWLVVTRSGGARFTISSEYSASSWEICDLMEGYRKRYGAAQPMSGLAS
jgi:hypothetical protein